MSEQVWYISHEIYSRILDVLAGYGYGCEADAAAEVRKQFALRSGVTYKLVVESEPERVHRSLIEIGILKQDDEDWNEDRKRGDW